MTAHPTEERIAQIRERQRTRPVEAVEDIEFLLSLLDRSAAGDAAVACQHCSNPIRRIGSAWLHVETELVTCRSRRHDGISRAEPAAAETTASDAATRMRDLCVGKVKARRDKYQAAADASSLPNDLTASRDAAVAAALTRLLGELSSLTLDQVEQEKTK